MLDRKAPVCPQSATVYRKNSMEVQHNKLGLWLFAVYLTFYTAFVLINAYAPEMMEREIGGLSLALLYGFGLIIVALVLAVVYGFLRRGGDES